MNYDMFLFYAHGEGDNGACANGYKELELSKMLVEKIVKLLESKEVKVLTNLGKDLNNYNRNLTKGHSFNYKMGATLHLNSHTTIAEGSMAIVPINEKSFNIEDEILQGLNRLGFNISRGLQSKEYTNDIFYKRTNGIKIGGLDWYREIREGWENGVSLTIFETCFINNPSEVKKYIDNIDKISVIFANAYLREMGKELIVVNTDKKEDNIVDGYYRVISGTFKDKDNANKECERLNNLGINSYVKFEK